MIDVLQAAAPLLDLLGSGKEVSESDRLKAFEDLLALQGDWMRRGHVSTFYEAVLAIALAEARRNPTIRDDASDIADEALIAFYSKDVRIANPMGWLRKTIENIGRVRTKKQRTIVRIDRDDLLLSGDEDSEATPPQVSDHVKNVVAEAIGTLSKSERDVALRYMEGRESLAAIGEELEIEPVAARVRWHRAKAKLRRYLAEHL